MPNGDFPVGSGEGDWEETTPASYSEEPPYEEYYSDEPPGDYYDQAPVNTEPTPKAPVRKGLESVSTQTLSEEARVLLLRLVGSCHMKEAGEVTRLIQKIQASKTVIGILAPEKQEAILDVCEALLYESGDEDEATLIDFNDLQTVQTGSQAHKILLKSVGYQKADPITRPQKALHHMRERIQRSRTKTQALDLVQAIETNTPTGDLLEIYKSIETPTTMGADRDRSFSKTAFEWELSEKEEPTTSLRFSSGLNSLDAALTGEGEDLGFLRTGEFAVVAAGTGHGKSTFARPVATAMTLDLVRGYGKKDAKAILAFAEEEPAPIIRAMRLRSQDRFHSVAKNIQLVQIGSSRKRLVQSVYNEVIEAMRKAEETRRPLTDFLPYIILIDYMGAICEPGEQQDSTAIEKTANLAMRGFAAWNIDEIEKYGEINFEEYAGVPWPRKEMASHRCAVLGFAQLRKPTKREVFQDGMAETDFVIEGPTGEPGWEVKDGDSIVPSREEVRGSSVLINHATMLIFLHRSRPKTGKVIDKVTGESHLQDTRMRIVVDKARNSVEVPFIPMRADSGPGTGRMMFWDDIAYDLLEAGILTGDNFDDVMVDRGDPMLPKRAPARILAAIRYATR